MSEPKDPNAVYEPAPYPRMLYATAEHHLIVHSADEEAAARARGFGEHTEIDPAKDGLDVLSKEQLIDIALGLVRSRMGLADVEEIVDAIRETREAAETEKAEALAKAEAEAAALNPPEPELEPAPEPAPEPEVEPAPEAQVEGDQSEPLDLEALKAKVKALQDSIAASAGAEKTAADEPADEPGETASDPAAVNFETMTDDVLRAFIIGRTNKAPHPNTKRPKLLDLAKAAHHPGAE